MLSVSSAQRFETSTIVCLRNSTARCPQPETGAFRTSARTFDHARPKDSPIERAIAFFHRTSANMTTLPARMASPMTAGIRSAVVALPDIASSPSANTGSPSFMKAFQIPVVEISKAISEPVKPHERNISYATPMETTPPPGRMFAMVVDDWLLTAACANERPGMAATICHQ